MIYLRRQNNLTIMKLRLLCVLFILSLSKIKSQIVDANAFLKGNYVELAIGPCGAFASTVAAPVGYHPRTDNFTGFLGFTADPAKDGWTTGSPDYVGDYFMPGSPEEGWGITIGTSNFNNNELCQQNDIPGSIISYFSNTSEVSAEWEGTIGGLLIRKRTYIPMNSLYFITEVNILNSTDSIINDIYYMRNVDPDQGELTPGGGSTFNTLNSIVYQNPDPCNKAFVSATTTQGNYYLGLGTIDSRAHVTYGGFHNRSAREVCEGSMSLYSTGSLNSDIAISLGFTLGSLLPGESTQFNYTYVLSEPDLNQALAATNINFNLSGSNLISGSQTEICANTDIPIVIHNTGSFTNWNWTPSTGLNTTTGDTVISNIDTPTTYTAVGTGSCGTVSLSIDINPVSIPIPGDAGSIIGSRILLPGDTNIVYSLDSVTNATHYLWTLPNGTSFTSGAATDSITLNAGLLPMCGTLTVTPHNVCGNGQSSYLDLCIIELIIDSIPNELCMEQNYNLNFNTNTELYNGNMFNLELSDANGYFSNPFIVGSLNSIQSGNIQFMIPTGTPVGSNYSLRLTSSNPYFVSTGVVNNFSVNSVKPVIDSLNDVIVCDDYVLPNLSSGSYFSLPNGLGIPLNSGDTITTSQTLYIYAVNQNCSSENNFNITFNYTPAVDNITSENVCDHFTLPVLANGIYFTETGGNGTTLNAGDTLINTQTVFIYNQSGICTAESSFTVSIISTPIVSTLNDTISCEYFILPQIIHGDYYSNPDGNGNLYSGDTISASQMIYIYAQDGICTNESNFSISISTIPPVDSLSDVTHCGDYVLPLITNGTYYTQSGGIGISLLPGLSVSQSGTIYIYAASGACSNESSFDCAITPYPNNAVINSDPYLTAMASGYAYQWVDCNNNYLSINEETQQTLNATQNGTYAVVIMDNGCAIMSDCYEINTVHVENESSIDPTIYPNPTTGILNLNFYKDNIAFQVIDITGKNVFSGISSISKNSTLTLVNQPDGIYYLVFENRRFKIIKN